MKRLTRMDGLRGVLAVYVMLGHALPFTDVPGWLGGMFHHGEAAVEVFFALSGLVIINSLERFEGKFWPFMQARARRLLPVYFLVLALAVLLLCTGSPLPRMGWVRPGSVAAQFWSPALPGTFWWHLLAHVTLTHGLLPQGLLPWAFITLLGPAWSLSSEWQFYVLAGLLAAMSRRKFTYLLLALGLGYHLLALPPWWQFSRAFLPDAAPYFALGAASAVWARGGGSKTFLVCLAATGLLGLSEGGGKFLVPLVWAAAMLAQRHPWGALLERRAVQYLGAISYPLYLANEPVQRAVAMLLAPLAHGDATAFSLMFVPLSLVAAVAVAAVLHHGVELRFMRPGNKNFSSIIAAAAGE